MTKFEQFLTEAGFINLKSKSTPELEELLNKIYTYCDNVHGKVTGSFFTESWQPNTKIKRGAKEGLDIHHKFEYDPDNSEVCSLSDKATAVEWFNKGYTKYQLAEHLVYCNWIEHQAIHAIIDILRARQFNGIYRVGCIEGKRAPILNKYYNDPDGYLETILNNEKFTSREYFKTALETVRDELDTYQLIMDEWANAVGVEDWLVFGYTLESLENCFETYTLDD